MSDASESAGSIGIPGLKFLVIAAGRDLFEQGAPSEQAYYIESGRVEVRITDGQHTIKVAEIGAGEIVGEMGVLGNEVRGATVTTIEPTKVAAISRRDLEERISTVSDPVIKSLINALLKRLQAANAEQMKHYKNLASFMDRMAGISAGADTIIPAEKRDAFAAEVAPILDQLEEILRKYRKN